MKLLLIDGNSLIFRAYYATAQGEIMKTSKGVYTNALYGFANLLNKAIKVIEPTHCAVAFDKGSHTFRKKMYEDYKAGRPETPQELKSQIPLVKEMLDVYNIKYIEDDDFEADDLIGSMSRKYDIDSVILSSDKDMYQLINDKVHVCSMKKGLSDFVEMDEWVLEAEWSLKPFQIIEYKALAGDNSDNIKGIAGIGDKTAKKLLNEYGSCEGIYQHLDDLKPKMREKFENGKEDCLLSKTLATIKTDVPIPFELDELELDIDKSKCNSFYGRYEMFSLVANRSALDDKKKKTSFPDNVD